MWNFNVKFWTNYLDFFLKRCNRVKMPGNFCIYNIECKFQRWAVQYSGRYSVLWHLRHSEFCTAYRNFGYFSKILLTASVGIGTCVFVVFVQSIVKALKKLFWRPFNAFFAFFSTALDVCSTFLPRIITSAQYHSTAYQIFGPRPALVNLLWKFESVIIRISPLGELWSFGRNGDAELNASGNEITSQNWIMFQSG